MRISIKNFNNLSDFDYEIADKKINFVFGISGAGKSSIARSLEKEPEEENALIGHSLSEVDVKINNKNVDYSTVKIFNSQYMENILIYKQEQKEIYEIIYGDGGRINEYKQKYLDSIRALNPIKDKLNITISNIDELISSLSISYKIKSKELKKTSKIAKVVNSVDSVKHYSFVKRFTSNEINWIANGVNTQAFSEGKCPFCFRKISESKKKKLLELSSFDAKDYEIINNKTGIFESLGISMPDFSKTKEKNQFLNSVHELFVVRDELLEIKNFIFIVQNLDFDISTIKEIKPSKLLSNRFPDFAIAINNLNADIKTIKKELGKLKEETNKVLDNNVKEINETLKLLGISYKFVRKKINSETKTATFEIHHVNDNSSIDRINGLSTGEKSIIGLLLFLIANKDSKIMIIDDPASSYDEYRRKAIFDFIYKYHLDSTVLVLSHDHVFAKFAVFHSRYLTNITNPSILQLKYISETGNIDYLETYDTAIVKQITMDDFKSIEECAKDIISSTNEMNYRTAINIRLLYELKKKTSRSNRMVYEYLSGIVHKIEKKEIILELENKYKGKTEKDVLNKIEKDLELKEMLLPLDDDYLSSKHDDLSVFEKVLFARFMINRRTKAGKIIYDELSNIIHLNAAYAICLNPYKFNYFSKYVYNYLVENHLM